MPKGAQRRTGRGDRHRLRRRAADDEASDHHIRARQHLQPRRDVAQARRIRGRRDEVPEGPRVVPDRDRRHGGHGRGVDDGYRVVAPVGDIDLAARRRHRDGAGQVAHRRGTAAELVHGARTDRRRFREVHAPTCRIDRDRGGRAGGKGRHRLQRGTRKRRHLSAPQVARIKNASCRRREARGSDAERHAGRGDRVGGGIDARDFLGRSGTRHKPMRRKDRPRCPRAPRAAESWRSPCCWRCRSRSPRSRTRSPHKRAPRRDPPRSRTALAAPESSRRPTAWTCRSRRRGRSPPRTPSSRPRSPPRRSALRPPRSR